METYPSVLPAWQHGYSFAPNNKGVLRTEFSTGRARQRNVADVRDDIFNVELLLTPQQLVIFEHFVNVLLQRVDWFSGPFHDGEGQREETLRLVSGDYQVQQRDDSNLYNVRSQIEIQDRQFDEYALLAAYLAPNTIDQYLGNLDDAWANWFTE